MSSLAWKLPGSCAKHENPDLWHTEAPGNTWETRLAKKICADCPVIDQCRECSILNEEPWGIWAGIGKNTRRRIIKTARRTA